MRRAALPTVVLAAALLGGCSTAEGAYPPETAQALQDRVAAVVEAANAQQWSTARTALARLRSDVDAARRLQQLSAERAAEVLAAADAVEAGLPRPAPSPRPTTAPPAPSPTQEEGRGDGGKGEGDEDGGKDGGKGEDKKDDDEGDG